MKIDTPHYMVVEPSPWLSSWYDNMAYIKIPIEEFNVHTFIIHIIIAKYGLPQDWNDDGKFGPERYIGYIFGVMKQ